MKAWTVEVKGVKEFTHTAFGKTAGEVRAAAVSRARDAGWRYSFKDILVRRNPSQDHFASPPSPGETKREEQ